MAKEGIGIVLALSLGAAVLTVGSLQGSYRVVGILAVVMWVLVVFSAYFFRDPKRRPPADEKAILSPADGKIISIRLDNEDEFIKAKVTRVAIFLSLFDVHINRAPTSGSVRYFRYQKGRFITAYKEEAGNLNEQTVIGINGSHGKFVVKQIAGKVARRIVCHLREGRPVTAGQKIGMIKLGSRVDLFLPPSVTLRVSEGVHVRAGETILGTIDNE